MNTKINIRAILSALRDRHQYSIWLASCLLLLSSSAFAVNFSDGGAALEGVLDAITVAPNPGNTSTDVNADSIDDNLDSYWRLNGGSSIMNTIAGNSSYTFGIFDATNPANRVALFSGGDSPGTLKAISILADGSVFVKFIDTGVDFSDNLIGFYIELNGSTWFSDTALNNDNLDHMTGYQGQSIDTIQIGSFVPGLWINNEFIFGWEDGVDGDYDDFVIIIESINPATPEQPQLASLGDRVWEDLNGDGIQGNGEPGIPNVSVNLFDENCTNPIPNGTTTTDNNGIYEFTGLEPNVNYCVKFDKDTVQQQLQCTDLPGFLGLAASPMNASGATGDTDSDADPVTGETANIVLSASQNDTSWDAGYYCPSKIGDKVVNDLNRNGIQEDNEPGISGQTVELLDCENGVAGKVITTTKTDSNGVYMFGLLPPDEYAIRFALPDDFVYSDRNVGKDETVDCDAHPNGVTDCVILAPNQNNADVDSCVNRPPSAGLGDFVFEDKNANGIQDADESGIPGVPVTLLTPGNDGNCGTADDVVESDTTTGADGMYAFNGLAGGTYCIVFNKTDVSCPFGDPIFSPQNSSGSTAANDSDSNKAGKTGNINLPEATFDSTWDAGIYCPANLGDRVWEDQDRDGNQTDGEPGIPGVTVELFDCAGNLVEDIAGNPVNATATVNDGLYGFTNLVPGQYTVKFTNANAALEFTTAGAQGVKDLFDSDAVNISPDGTMGTTECIILNSGEQDPSWDAGLREKPGSKLGDFVWEDLNADGIQDNELDQGIEGVKVDLLSCDAVDVKTPTGDTATTDVNGQYLFDNLLSGRYAVKFTQPNGYLPSPQNIDDGQPNADARDSDADSVNGETACVDLGVNDTNLSLDAGFFKPATLGDRIWNDANKDGIQNLDEANIEGVEVELFDCQGNPVTDVFGDPVVPTTSNISGEYDFNSLLPGMYSVKFTNFDDSLTFTQAGPLGVKDPNDSDASVISTDGTMGTTECITLESGEVDPTWDAGLFMPEVCSECDGKVTELTLKYNGASPAVIRVEQKDGVVVFDEQVMPGGTFAFSGVDKHGTLGTEISIFVDDALNTKIHTSCSKPIGPGLIAGLFEVTRAVSLNGGLICPIDPPPPSGDCSECDGKVTKMTLQYNGSDPAFIKVVQKKDGVVFNELVLPGDTFTFSGTDKKGTLGTEISIYVNDALNTKIHTSCSKPVGPGLIAGMFEVIEAYSRNGGMICPIDPPPPAGTCSECDGKVTELTLQYNGSVEARIVVKQKKDGVVFDAIVQPGGQFTFSGTDKKDTLGTEISIFVDGSLNAKIHTSCSKPIGPGLVAGNFEVIEGYSRNGGLMCPINTPPPPPTDGCSECDGKVTMLTMQYNGSEAARVVVEQKKDGVVFDAIVQPGGQFTFSGTDKKDTLGTEISIFVAGSLNTKIHTSCSQPIGPGFVSGDFEVIEGYSRNGGLMCPVSQ